MDKFLNVLVEGNLDVFVWVIILVAVLIIGALLGALGTYFLAKEKVKKATSNAEKIINDANLKAEKIQKNAQIDAKQTVFEMKQEADKDIKERKQEVIVQENKLLQREQSIDARDQALLKKENALENKEKNLDRQIEDNKRKAETLNEKINSILAELENPKAKEANIIVMHTRCKEFAGFAHKDYWSLQTDFNEEDYPNLKCMLIGDTHVNMTIVKPETGKVYVSPGSIEMCKSNEPIVKYVVEYDTDTNQTNCIEIVPSYHIIRSELPITTEDQLSQFIQDIRGKSIGVPPNRAFIIVTYSPQMETQVLSQIKNEIINNRENVILQGYAIPIIATPDNKELVYVQPSGDLDVIDSIVDFVTKKGCSMDKPLGLSQDGFNLFKNLIDKAHNTEQELNAYVNNNE